MPPSSNCGPSPKQAIDFLTTLTALKETKRTGWVRSGIAGPESISDHMYRMGMMSLLVRDLDVDFRRCMELALVHDVAESVVGDITPHCGVSDADKERLERAAIQGLAERLGGGMRSEEGAEPRLNSVPEALKELWEEYEAGSTKEAALVKDFDKLEMILQAAEYEQSRGSLLEGFFESTKDKWRTELGRAWAEEIVSRRPEQSVDA
ncbi:HD domain-containing protein [Helicosporidium sp. ATCC 50920]|nr:HD domain-containing protein [Helicosporidium sp. ATCC 50920]|eukprot:KDD75341.1 HD domain-containing protein [Helicosporidium sp. ATCC 50920]